MQDGFGLNPVAGRGDATHQYFGESVIAEQVRLAPGAVVLLFHLCYASGLAEPGVPEGAEATARQRVDNFAAGFLAAGAAAVAADAYASPVPYLRTLLGQRKSARTAWDRAPTANGNVRAFASERTRGAIALMDPEKPTSGFTAIAGPRRGQRRGIVPAGPGARQDDAAGRLGDRRAPAAVDRTRRLRPRGPARHAGAGRDAAGRVDRRAPPAG